MLERYLDRVSLRNDALAVIEQPERTAGGLQPIAIGRPICRSWRDFPTT